MAAKYYLGIDQGTSGTMALLLDSGWNVAAQGYKKYGQIYPKPGWVEHDPIEVWEAVVNATSIALEKAGARPQEIACIGLANEGETVMAWDKFTGVPVYNAIVWQDRRTARYADALNEKYGKLIHEKTGLKADAYFSATKIRWILDNVPEAKEKAAAGKLLFGTMDSFLIWKMTNGRVHITDCSTASRTMLLNIHKGCWDDDILDIFELDKQTLPKIMDSSMLYGYTDPEEFFGARIPISGAVVDQQAALFGQACFTPGSVKTTYGTGCFMLMNTGDRPICSLNGLLTTVAWRLSGKMTYALDGGVYVTGAATQWLRDNLKIINTAAEAEKLAIEAGSNGGVYFVPAFTGLAAPYWDSYARGMIIGITRGTTKAEIVRATLEATAYQVKDNLDVMNKDSGISIDSMRVDGGAVVNNFLMQFQSDILNIPIDVPEITEITALGVSYLAALGIGEFRSVDDLCGHRKLGKHFEPKMGCDEREALLKEWHRAVERSRNWIEN